MTNILIISLGKFIGIYLLFKLVHKLVAQQLLSNFSFSKLQFLQELHINNQYFM